MIGASRLLLARVACASFARLAARLAALAALTLAGGCAGKQGPHAAAAPATAVSAPAADSVTIALWRFDENGGSRALDSGPYRLHGIAGSDTRTNFGRFRSARSFQRLDQSFVYVPYNPVMDPPGGFTIEAWIELHSVAPFELQPIAARWSQSPGEQSWVFGVTGQKLFSEAQLWFTDIVLGAPQNHLILGYQPLNAAAPRGVYSISALPLDRWVHVAATCDGEVVRLYIDGRLDAQSAVTSGIRPSTAPLFVGSLFNERRLTDFGGDMRYENTTNQALLYQFAGDIDELRLSSAARHTFDSAPLR